MPARRLELQRPKVTELSYNESGEGSGKFEFILNNDGPIPVFGVTLKINEYKFTESDSFVVIEDKEKSVGIMPPIRTKTPTFEFSYNAEYGSGSVKDQYAARVCNSDKNVIHEIDAEISGVVTSTNVKGEKPAHPVYKDEEENKCDTPSDYSTKPPEDDDGPSIGGSIEF